MNARPIFESLLRPQTAKKRVDLKESVSFSRFFHFEVLNALECSSKIDVFLSYMYLVAMFELKNSLS